MTDAPERIWIEDEFGDGHEDQWSYGSWDCRNVYDYVHEYVRADLHAALEAQLAEAKEALESIRREAKANAYGSAHIICHACANADDEATITLAKLEEKK